jgi:cell division protein YceG involved in septum cleavage
MKPMIMKIIVIAGLIIILLFGALMIFKLTNQKNKPSQDTHQSNTSFQVEPNATKTPIPSISVKSKYIPN